MRVRFEQIKPHIGANVYVERGALCDDDVVQQCLDALEDRGILVFPRLDLTDAEQLAFTDKLGGRVNYFKGRPVAQSDVLKVTLDEDVNEAPDTVQGTYFWHLDGTTVKAPPPKASLLLARGVAPRGGQTDFANTVVAYETLSDADKRDIAGLRVKHDIFTAMRLVTNSPTEEQIARWNHYCTEQNLPLVWTHKSGRKSLLLAHSADYIFDMPEPDGRSLLARLLEWTVQPDFSYRHEWQVGDMVIWDNYGTIHRALPYAMNSGRMMHRTTVAGVEMFG